MKSLRLLRMAVVLVLALLLMQQVVYAASSKKILIYNIAFTRYGLTGDPAKDEEPEKYFQTLVDSLESEGFTVDYKTRKEVPHLGKDFLQQYGQIWMFETDADSNNHDFDFKQDEVDNLLFYVKDKTGALMIAGEEDFYRKVYDTNDNFFDKFFGVVLQAIGVIVAIVTGFTGVGVVVGVVIFEAGRNLYNDGFRHGVAPGNVNSFGTIPSEVQQLLDQITYGNQVSFTNNINQVSSELGVVYLGVTTDRACETSNHLYHLIGSSTVRSGITETPGQSGRFYNPLCRSPSVNVAGGANSGGCNCIQLEPQPVTEEPVDKSHAVFKDVNTIYVDGREPLMIPFNAGLQYLEVGKLQKLRADNENKNHVFAYAIPNILDEAQNKVSGKIYFESSWTRFTNNYPLENQNNIEQGDTIQYAINIAKWLEPSPDISSDTCIVDPDSPIGDWKNQDSNIATPSDNCCYENKIGTIIDGGKFACLEE